MACELRNVDKCADFSQVSSQTGRVFSGGGLSSRTSKEVVITVLAAVRW